VLDITTPGINDAFIDFPAGTLTPAGTGSYYYDWVVERWLPVARRQVSSDGRQYAITKYIELSQPPIMRVHVVDAATGVDAQVTTMPDYRAYAVVDFTSTGVILVPYGDTVEPGVWRLDPSSGGLTRISPGYYQPPVQEWAGIVDPRDPNPQVSNATGSPVSMPDRIDRLDESGKTTTWMYKPGYWVYWFAFEGPPLLLVEASRVDLAGIHYYQYWLVSGPGRSTLLASYSGDELSPYRDLVFASGLADKHGIWISGAQSVYLVKRNGAILDVSSHGAVPVGACG
jgi:hypothetical protein